MFKYKIYLLSILLWQLLIAKAAANDRELGLGFALGSPTAITGKLWVQPMQAIDFGIGFGWSSWMLYGDYHWNKPQIFGTKTQFLRDLTGYIGAGAGLAIWSHVESCGRFACKSKDSGTAIFVRAPIGTEWYPEDPRIGVFLEIAPVLAIVPGFGGTVDFQIGGRYYF